MGAKVPKQHPMCLELVAYGRRWNLGIRIPVPGAFAMPLTDHPHPLDGRIRTRSLLDLDSELARALPAERHPAAHADLRVHVH